MRLSERREKACGEFGLEGQKSFSGENKNLVHWSQKTNYLIFIIIFFDFRNKSRGFRVGSTVFGFINPHMPGFLLEPL